MKNSIFIDLDTEREDKPIMFGKPPELPQPETPQEAQEMILNDIATLVESLAVLIEMAHVNKYADKLQMVNNAKTVLDSVVAYNHDEITYNSNEDNETSEENDNG